MNVDERPNSKEAGGTGAGTASPVEEMEVQDHEKQQGQHQ
jgi:hypothetical protein